jgi:maleate isomerase
MRGSVSVNFSFAEVAEDRIRVMIRDVAAARPKAITTFCTNLRAAHLAAELEAELLIPIFDTISTVVWKSLQIADIDTRRVRGWGNLFSQQA